MNKRNIFLLAILLLQIVLIGYMYRPGKETVAPVVEFFPGIEQDKVIGLIITDNEQDSITLKKGEQGWTIEPDGYPVNGIKADSLAGKLVSLKSTRLVTRTASSRIRLKVDDETFEQKIKILIDDGKSYLIFLGASPGNNTIHVRMEGEDEVFLVKGLSSWEAPTENSAWWKNRYVEMTPEELVEVELTNSHGSFKITKGKDNTWKNVESGADETVSMEKAEEFLRRAGMISLTKYLGRDEDESYGLKTPVAELILQSKQKSISLKIGPKDEETDNHVVKASDSPFYVRVGSFVIKDILEKKFEDLLDQPQSPSSVQ
ncbi:MAG: DUF4340 domain-containing protein [Thermodesulfobacteriota bacterium]|nr:DUF4340 domain-containing protein [Thermodesulfobacteriota bacterium]